MSYDPIDYLNHIIDEMDHLLEISDGKDLNWFLNERSYSRAALRSFEVIGEATKKLDKEFTNKYPDVPWSDMAKMRDKLIHNYMEVDYRIVWDTMIHSVPFSRIKILEIIKQNKNG